MVAYIDLIVLENFCMNLLILYTTAKLLGNSINKSRMIIASIVGTMYVFSLCFKFSNTILTISKVIMGLIVVGIGIQSKGFIGTIKNTSVYFFTSFIYAGCALGFLHIVKPKVIYIVNGIIIGGEYIFEIVGISSIISFILIKTSMKLIKLKSYFRKKNMICNIELFLNDRSLKLKALLDSGNLLTDTITGAPVIIVYKEKIRALFDNCYLKYIDSLTEGGDIENEFYNEYNIRVIPYVSVGQSNGLMVVCKVDKVKVEYQGESNVIDNVLIGFYNEALSKNDKYSALIGLQILEGSKIDNEHISNVKSKGKYSICKVH